VDWAAWHLPGGLVDPQAISAATSNVKGGSGTEEEANGPLAREEGSTRINYLPGPQVPSYATAYGAGLRNWP